MRADLTPRGEQLSQLDRISFLDPAAFCRWVKDVERQLSIRRARAFRDIRDRCMELS